MPLPREQPPRHGEEGQREREAIAEDAQFLRAAVCIDLPLHAALHLGHCARGALVLLPRVEERLLEHLHLRERRALLGEEVVEADAALADLRVARRAFGGALRGDGVVQLVAGRARVGLGLLQHEACLVQVGLRALAGELRGLGGHLERRVLTLVDEILDRAHALDLGQVAHDRLAQAREEPGEGEGDDPQAALEPLLGKPLGGSHGHLLGQGFKLRMIAPPSRAPPRWPKGPSPSGPGLTGGKSRRGKASRVKSRSPDFLGTVRRWK